MRPSTKRSTQWTRITLLGACAIATVGSISFSSTVWAHDESDDKSPPAPHKGPKDEPRKEKGEFVDPMVAGLLTLDLTKEQKEKIKPTLEDMWKNLKKTHMEKRDGDKDELKKALNEIRDGARAKIEPELTEPQLKKYHEYLATHREDARKGPPQNKDQGPRKDDSSKGDSSKSDSSKSDAPKGDAPKDSVPPKDAPKNKGDSKTGDGWEPAK